LAVTIGLAAVSVMVSAALLLMAANLLDGR